MRYNKSILILLLTALVIVSCGKDDDKTTRRVYVDDTDGVEYHLYDLYTDKYGNEGLVVYIRCDSTYKYIQVISVDETTDIWGPTGETIFKGNQDSAGYFQFGLAMLQCMKTRGIEHFPAQRWCDVKNGNEQYPRAGSWRLPSIGDLFRICGADGINVDTINYHLEALGKVLFSKHDMYWCCEEDYEGYITWADGTSQDYDPYNRAIAVSPISTLYSDKDFWIKKKRNKVRAIKTIYHVSYQ